MAGGLKGNWNVELPRLIGQVEQLASKGFRLNLNKRLGLQGLQLVKSGFRSSTAPDGAPWAAVLRGGKPLRDTGRLGNSFTLDVTSRGFIIGTNVSYAGTHQSGARISAKTAKWLTFRIGKEWARKKSVVIPARPMLPEGDLPPKWNQAFETVILKAWDDLWR